MAKVKQKQVEEVKSISTNETLTNRFKRLLREEAELWYEASLTAYEIYQQREWERLGYLNVRDYVEEEFRDIGLSYRVFMYRVKMGETIRTFGIKKDEISGIGWAKFKEISSILLDDNYPLVEKNAKELIELAKQNSLRELQEAVKERKMEFKQVPEKETFKFVFVLSNEYGRIVDEALQKIKQEYGLGDDNEALYQLCLNYLTGQE